MRGGHPRKTLAYLSGTLLHPRRTARLVLAEESIRLALGVVMWFGILFGLALLWTQLTRTYPFPAEQVRVWNDAWNDFAIQPFIKVDPAAYRLAQAIFILPLVLAIWVLMAGTARLMAILFHGKRTFDEYLKSVWIQLFAVWAATLIVDNLYNSILQFVIVPHLPVQPPSLERALVVYLPSMVGILGILLAGVYNALVTREAEQFSWPKAAAVGLATLSGLSFYQPSCCAKSYFYGQFLPRSTHFNSRRHQPLSINIQSGTGNRTAWIEEFDCGKLIPKAELGRFFSISIPVEE